MGTKSNYEMWLGKAHPVLTHFSKKEKGTLWDKKSTINNYSPFYHATHPKGTAFAVERVCKFMRQKISGFNSSIVRLFYSNKENNLIFEHYQLDRQR